MRLAGGFTRRTLLTRTAMALTGSAFASLLSACASPAPSIGAPTSVAGAPATTAPAATSKPAAAPTTAPAATSAPAAASGGRATGGPLKILMWQGPTILNTHLSQGTKDSIAGRFCCEPLMTAAADGTLSSVLATEVPSKENGGISADGKTVTYRLKQGIRWADGQPFTADDVVFTFEYITNTDTAATTLGLYTDLDKVEPVDPMTVRLTFKQP